MGFNPATGGLILSADSLAAFIVQPLITPLIHAGNARRWLLGGAILFSLSLFMLGQLSAIPLLIAARLLQGAGFICVLSSLITMLIPFIPPGMSGRAFGYVSLVRLVPYADSAAILFFLAVVTGLGWGIAMPLQAAAMFDISLPPARALNQNLLLIMMQGGFFLGPLLGGQLIAGFGYIALFACLATSTLAAAVMMTLSRQTSSSQPPDNNKVKSISH